jgi:hypothetical protein
MQAPSSKNEPAALPAPSVPWGRQLPLLASVAFTVALALWVGQAGDCRAWFAGAASLGVGLLAARRPGRVERVLGWGVAVVLASLGPQAEHRGLEACGALGAMACAAAASVAITRIPSTGGVVRAAILSPVVAVVCVALLWWAALVACLAPPDGPLAWMTEYRRVWGLGAVGGSAVVLLAQTQWMLHRRRLELGVVERALAMRASLGMSFGAALLVGLLGRAQADALGRLVIALASVLVAGAALHPDAVRVARLTRRAVVLAITGGAVALIGAAAVAGGRIDPWEATLVTAAVALAIGSAAPSLEAPLRPARGRWLDAFARACAEASRAEPDDAIREVLVALRAPGGLSSPSPELWTIAPPGATSVDLAGYLHHRDADLPEALLVAAVHEPEGTLRAEVLDALEVRRPDLRPLSKWMADRGVLLATVVAFDGEAEGVLVLPRVHRGEPPTLEEVRALRGVADRVAAACRARALRMRMLARVNDAHRRADSADERLERLLHDRALDAERDALAAARLARPASVGVYSAGSRMALEALERRTSVGAPIAIVAPSGVDPVPYLAHAHLAGARRAAPLVLVDSTSAREHDLGRWGDPLASPLALANRGMLVLLDGAALPADVQQLVARALAEKHAPWDRPEPLDVQIALTGIIKPDQLVARGRLDPSLALRLADACAWPVTLPRLRDRVEDLRAIVTDRLAREGLRVLGRPVGIEHAAYARLVEHLFPGEDAELAVIVKCLVARCSGDVVRAADVDPLLLRSPDSAPWGLRSAEPLSGPAKRGERRFGGRPRT